MGTDKAFLRLGHLTLLEHAIATAKEVCDSVVLVGDKAKLRPYGWVVQDKFPGQGPLAGIHAALASESARFSNLMLSVDTPELSANFLKYLLKKSQESIAQVTVPRAEGHLQTLCAVYRREFATVAEQALRDSRNKIDPLFSLVPVQVIEESEWKGLGFTADIFDNVNTPEDWQRMHERFGAQAR
jgi:molybdopterin-guanine dinucleotide biosynthesis protein A